MSDPRRAWGRRNHRAGLAAEDIAARWYQARGAEVLARRWRGPEGEIDIVLREGGCLVFVEVKAGRTAEARDVISAAQWARLERTALRYMLLAQTGEIPARFDAAFVGADGAVAVVENARASEAW